jgi:hypothetical protein
MLFGIVIFSIIDTFKKVFTSEQKLDFNLVKIHAMTHYVNSIKKFGVLFEYSANIYKHLHITLMKVAYRGSNRHDYMGYIVKHN